MPRKGRIRISTTVIGSLENTFKPNIELKLRHTGVQRSQRNRRFIPVITGEVSRELSLCSVNIILCRT